jgi:hypothetical protein
LGGFTFCGFFLNKADKHHELLIKRHATMDDTGLSSMMAKTLAVIVCCL